jgi:hypothetical protein
MRELKTYGVLLADLSMFLISSLSNLDLEIRIVSGACAVIVMVLTGIKVIQQIKKERLQNELLKWTVKMEEEKVRRFFEEKHNNETKQLKDDNSDKTS